ncbi:MAG: hypothetical protein JWR18_832 [Segetibacter sp.]|jgi:hypothetical protein|nr:hypothetical protein [Segetibacter sp.]
MNEMRRNDVERSFYCLDKKKKLWARRLTKNRSIVASHSSTANHSSTKTSVEMHEIKSCPCCDQHVECRAGSIAICQCVEVNISIETREFLAKNYDECLCKECLKKLEKATSAKKDEC